LLHTLLDLPTSPKPGTDFNIPPSAIRSHKGRLLAKRAKKFKKWDIDPESHDAEELLELLEGDGSSSDSEPEFSSDPDSDSLLDGKKGKWKGKAKDKKETSGYTKWKVFCNDHLDHLVSTELRREAIPEHVWREVEKRFEEMESERLDKGKGKGREV
jgi:hypothetical protein